MVVYIDDRDMFVAVAEELGIRGIVHRGYVSTREALARLGLDL
jgi:putative hydrolase of the HAD superfamily